MCILQRGDSSPLQSERNSPSPPYGEDPYIEHLGKFPFSQEFVTTFLSMPPKSKHAFETGRILEDIIFHSVRFAPPNSKWIKNNPILHWILDLKCDDVRKWFSKAERAEIMSMGPPLPPRDAGFEFAVERFPKVCPTLPHLPCSVNQLNLQVPESFEQLLDITESLTRPAGTQYVRAAHCNATYSNHAAIAMFVPPSTTIHFASSNTTKVSESSSHITAVPGLVLKISGRVGSPTSGNPWSTIAYTRSRPSLFSAPISSHRQVSTTTTGLMAFSALSFKILPYMSWGVLRSLEFLKRLQRQKEKPILRS